MIRPPNCTARELREIELEGWVGEARAWSEVDYATELGSPYGRLFLNPPTRPFGGFVLWRWVDEAAGLAEILHLAVRTKGRGHGRELLKEFLRAAGPKTVWLEVAESNQPAVALYGKLNFRQVGRRERYYSDGQAALTMVLELG